MVKQAANAYIYNRIFSYLVWAVGITTALGQLGIPWDRAQWFVLAIVVGLGLGLQDIVANFFSGLIILLERPIRVGDTVTISERDGTVKKISIRATVIETFDRIELIVPNRLLISNQLTNWSLSSVIIRLSLWYGVSHDSDHNLVRRLLLQAAAESNSVRTTPVSEAAFFEYTEHSQRYELRIFLSHADDRFIARNQVNSRVHELFEEHGITIAHMQHDVHFNGQSSELLIGK
nr:mechanosensitive ion channel domain-containing protein [Endozoicomonas sp. OPT23]